MTAVDYRALIDGAMLHHRSTTTYTTAQAAEYLGISQERVRKLIRERVIQARVINPRSKKPTYRITGAALARYEQAVTR